MKPRHRLLWIKWHAYLSCLFLPLALLYAITGAVYLFDIKGGNESEQHIYLEADTPWPESAEQAKALVLSYLEKNDLGDLPEILYQEHQLYAWWNFHQEVTLMPSKEANMLTLHIDHYDLWKQMIFIHKGIAGDIFVILGILIGISITISLITGVVVAISVPSYKKNSIVLIIAGTLLIIAAYFAS